MCQCKCKPLNKKLSYLCLLGIEFRPFLRPRGRFYYKIKMNDTGELEISIWKS